MQKTGRIIAGLFACALALWAVQASAATEAIGRSFNHMTTGFPLSGGHATAACETCHVGGVFKGTPRNCDGCHAMGKRVIATPKPNSHIVTDAPCESCHFYTHTWLGARYNHGSAVAGQCRNCHVGRLAMGKPASHGTGNKATQSCDSCHRTFAWTPASWNHVGVVPGSCATCHNGTNATGKTASHTGAKGTLACDDCHRQTGWIPATYTHRGVVPGSCATCHNGSAATGKTATHTGLKGTLSCDECHTKTAWLPAQFAHNTGAACSSCHNGSLAIGKTASHTTVAKATFACNDCHHTTTSWLPAQYVHTSPAACSSCHNGTVAVGKGTGHIATTDECNQCHTNTTSWLGALGGKPANHIPYNAGVNCSSCHVGTSVTKGQTLHTYVSSMPCITCHLKNNPYAGWGQDTKSIGHEGMKSGDDCSQSGCHKPLGSKGTAYINWD